MKRKALITATAVLLVAVMCLATASYAWFTSGTASGVSGISLSVGGSDGALLLAPAQMGNKYTAVSWRSALTLDNWTDMGEGDTEADRWAVKPENNTLTAVSTADGVNFFPAKYDTSTEYEKGIWTAQEATKDGYLLFSFWVKAPSAGTASVSVSLPTSATAFMDAVKLGMAVTEGTPGEVTEDPTLKIYDCAADDKDAYKPVTGAGAVSTKDANDRFVPAGDSTGFAAEGRAQATYVDKSLTLDFTAKDETQLVTVALWLEGMDEQCQGDWSVSNQAVAITLNWGA